MGSSINSINARPSAWMELNTRDGGVMVVVLIVATESFSFTTVNVPNLPARKQYCLRAKPQSIMVRSQTALGRRASSSHQSGSVDGANQRLGGILHDGDVVVGAN